MVTTKKGDNISKFNFRMIPIHNAPPNPVSIVK
jgi:hypothetical protein